MSVDHEPNASAPDASELADETRQEQQLLDMDVEFVALRFGRNRYRARCEGGAIVVGRQIHLHAALPARGTPSQLRPLPPPPPVLLQTKDTETNDRSLPDLAHTPSGMPVIARANPAADEEDAGGAGGDPRTGGGNTAAIDKERHASHKDTLKPVDDPNVKEVRKDGVLCASR